MTNHICPTCNENFERFKLLRRHWNKGECCADATAEHGPEDTATADNSPATQSPIRRQIDPGLNLWLNNDDNYSRLDDTIWIDDDDSDSDNNDYDDDENDECPEQIENDTRDQLLYALLDVVEKLSDTVLRMQETHPRHEASMYHQQLSAPHHVRPEELSAALTTALASAPLQAPGRDGSAGAPGAASSEGRCANTTNAQSIRHEWTTVQRQTKPRQASSRNQQQRPAAHHVRPEELSAALTTALASTPEHAPENNDSACAPAAANSRGRRINTTSAPSIHHVQPGELSAALATALAAAPVQAGRAVSPTPSAHHSAAANHNRRPQVVINNQPESDNAAWRTVPGNSTYAGTVKNGRKVALFSDSICNRMNKHELRKKLQCNINKKSFPGATTDDMYEHYMMPTLKRNTPDTAIIHIGVNDILAKGTPDGGLTANSIEQIAKNVVRCGEVCQSAGVNKICISSILTFRGRRAQSTINHMNNQLAELCKDKSFDFILNDNITMDRKNTLYYGDGLHLNDAGRDVLMENFSSYLRKD